MRKYEFTGKTTVFADNIILRQIRRLSDGLIGGYIEDESNLSHDGDCFVFENAQVGGDARVYGNARVFGDARVYGNAVVSGDAWVSGDAQVFGYARVYGNAVVSGDAQVYENARVFENAVVSGDAWVSGDAQVTKTPICVTGVIHSITVTETHIFIGCEGHTIDYWRKNIKQIGKKHGYCAQEIKATIVLIKGAMLAKKAGY